MAHLYKSGLHNYAQKRNISFPTYTCEMQGLPHAPQFKAHVTIDGNTFHGPEFCSTLKDAEHAAAKVAFMSLSPDGEQEVDCLYKSLLQELAQKKGLLPVYSTDRTGLPHIPCFTSTVQIKDECYLGQEARTKKQAEMNAAKVAYNAVAQGGPRANNVTGLRADDATGLRANIATKSGASIAIGPRANVTGANNSTTFSNIQTVGASSSKSSCLQTVMTQIIEPTLILPTSKMQTIINDQTTYSVENESEKTQGYVDLRNFHNIIEKHTITSVIHQSQPEATPNVVNFAKLSIQQENLLTQAGTNGNIIQSSFNEATSNSVVDSSAARPHSNKIVIRPNMPGMMFDGPIHVSDDEWVAMKVNVYEEA